MVKVIRDLKFIGGLYRVTYLIWTPKLLAPLCTGKLPGLNVTSLRPVLPIILNFLTKLFLLLISFLNICTNCLSNLKTFGCTSL